MVKGLVDIDDETNRILNLVKAKYNLNDKGQAIAFIVKRFKDNEVPEELKYINDGDKWILAEDIPDMDPYFMQIPLSCYVNEFESPSGRAYKKMLAVYDKYHLLFYYGDKDANEVGENIVNKFMSNPDFATETNKKIMEYSDILREFSESVPENNLNKLSNKQLWEIYEEQDKIHSEYYQWGWIPVAADMFHSNLTNRLKEYFKSLNISDEKINEYFIVLTTPTKKSLVQIEREEFLQLAASIKRDNYHKKLFQELYTGFREQEIAKFGYKTHSKEYEELLEQKVSSLIAHIKPEILKKINNYYGKYFYVNRMWTGKPHTIEYYLKELVKLIDARADPEATLEAGEKEFKIGVEKRNVLIKQLKIDKRWLTLFDAFGDFMVTKIYRRYSQIYAMYRMEFILNEIATRFNLTLMQTRFLLPDEMKRMLIDSMVDKEELMKRIEFCVYYAEKGKDVIYTDVRAQELAEKARKVDVSNVEELKGQTGCLGKATGRVRIIVRHADMHKMHRGDILVSIATDPDIVPAMRKAAAIVTEQGGVTSHAAIVSRELGIPCVIGTKIATKVLKDGDLVEVNANHGVVKILKE